MRLSRTGLVVAIFAAIVVAVVAPQAPALVHDLAGPSFPDALTALGSLIAVALAGWVLAVALLAAAGVSSHLVARITPSVLRGVLLTGAAGALAIGPAHASQVVGPAPQLPYSVSGLPLPDRPDARPLQRSVEVRPGDTLWAIAAHSLPAEATDAEIAAATRAWHRANRDVIGANPHLIFPTQRLIQPTVKDLP